MPRFIILTDEVGEKVAVNCYHITHFFATEDADTLKVLPKLKGMTVVNVIGEKQPLFVKDTPPHIWYMIYGTPAPLNLFGDK